MVQRILLAAIAILIMASFGCSDMLDAQAAKDRDLAKAVGDNLSTSPDFSTYYVSFEFGKAPGEYIFDLKDVPDGQTAGKLGYNSIIVLIERNDTKVKTGRPKFVVHGTMGGEPIFDATKTIGPGQPIQVTLLGIYEGQVFTPNIK